MFKKYKWNVVAVVLLVSIIGFVIFDVFFYFNIKSYLFNQTFHEMQTQTQLVLKFWEEKQLLPIEKNIDELFNVTYQLRDIVGSRVTIINADGRVLTDSDVARERVELMDNHLHRPEVQEAILHGWGQRYRRSDTVKQHIFYTAYKLTNNDQRVGFLRLAYYAQNFEASLDNIANLILGANVLGLAILFLVAFSLGNLVTKPITRMVNTAHKISDGNLTATFNTVRRDEFGYLASMLNELTGRLKMQITQITDERSKLEHILTNLNLGIIVIDHHKIIQHANPEAFRILELEQTEIININVIEIIRSEEMLAAINATLKSQTTQKGEYTTFLQPTKKFIRYLITPYSLTGESIKGVLIQFQDVTELRRLEAIRRDFVTNASHELKTPLTSIIGYADTLLEGAADNPESRIKFIRKIREQGQRLEFLVSDLLRLSEMERELPLEVKPAALKPLLIEIVDEFADKANAKQIKISIDVSESIKVLMDRENIRTALNNLIDNAIKYTHVKGAIDVFVTEQPDNCVTVSVKDNGIGIDPKYHERIFQRFYRVDKARSRAMGGTGLGLAIVKHILDRHGSNVGVDSSLEKGCRIYFMLKKV
ncbi:PAS domain-containing protein [candidate division KSB1 bacterium]|nr:PAS domain-containing protein [candidate division KSB1 bacterium]